MSNEERFWAKVDKRGPDECWEWIGSKHAIGYGFFRREGKTKRSHRVSYELAFGSIPPGEGYHGTCVLHRCDNPSCVNPAHLFLGSQADNMADAKKKGRRPPLHGSKNPNARLDIGAVRRIRDLYAAGGLSQEKLGERFGVSQLQISRIVNHKRWVEV